MSHWVGLALIAIVFSAGCCQLASWMDAGIRRLCDRRTAPVVKTWTVRFNQYGGIKIELDAATSLGALGVLHSIYASPRKVARA